MLVDTHCHLNFDSYDSDRAAVIKSAAANNVSIIINPSVNLETIAAILDLTKDHRGIYAAVGIHPNSTANFAIDHIHQIASAARMPKVVAIGEIGLDYYWRESPKEKQWQAFEAQLEIAQQVELPVIIHNREASDDVMAILETWVKNLPISIRERPGVLHSFSASPSIAERALKAGFYLGFTGPLTYKNADQLRHIVANVPMNRIVLETDGPFLTPVPYRGKRNEPAYIPLIAERLAAIKQLPVEEIAQATTENALHLFRIEQ